MWTNIQWVITAYLIIGLSFSWWRRLRVEQKSETIYELLTWVTLASVVAGVMGNKILYGRWGWWEGSGILAILITVAIGCKKLEADFWEWLDMLVIVTMVWATAVSMVWMAFLKAGLLLGGIGVVWMTKKTYRSWRWYKSGRPGAVGMIGLVWWGITQVAVAFLRPDKLYWGELTANQWIGSWILTAAIVGLFLRSGIKLWPKTKPKKIAQ